MGKYVLDNWRRRFIRRVLTATGIVQLPVVIALSVFVCTWLQSSLGILLVILGVLLGNLPLLRVLLRGRDDVRSNRLRVWLIDGPYALHLCASLFSAAFMYAVLLIGLWKSSVFSAAKLALVVYAIGWLMALYGSLVRRFWVIEKRFTIPLGKRSDSNTNITNKTATQRFTIAQLSDIHVGPYLPRWYYLHLVEKVGRMRSDAVVVTGDMITDGPGYIDELQEFAVALVRACAPAKVYACMGNHDYYGVTEHVADVWKNAGAVLLRNESASLLPNVMIAAVDDVASRKGQLERTLAQREHYEHCVLLAHDPASFPSIAQRQDVDLVLSGHTHAGQIAVPFFQQYNLARLRERYTYGMHQSGRTKMYVHPGNGTSGPPIRVGTAPEIAVFELVIS